MSVAYLYTQSVGNWVRMPAWHEGGCEGIYSHSHQWREGNVDDRDLTRV
jgi:hypothetical protein